MKKRLLFVALLCLNASAFACEFSTNDSEKIRKIVKDNGGYPVSDKVCEILNKNGMSLQVSGNAAVLDGANVSYAQVRLWKNGVVSDESAYSMKVNASGRGSQDTANDQMIDALRAAIQELNYIKAINEVNVYTAKLTKKQ